MGRWCVSTDIDLIAGYRYTMLKEVILMKQNSPFEHFQLFLAPALLILLGAVLIVSPDSASALIARLLGWLLAFLGICCGIAALASPQGRAGKVFAAIALAVAGGTLAKNPLILAAWIGRFIGIVLLVNALSDFFAARRIGLRPGFSFVTAILGLVLIVLPMTASRLLFTLCGVAVAAVGVVMLLSRLKTPRDPRDPNIIDAL